MQDVSIGEYMCFGALVVRLGGWTWPPAIKAAKRSFYLCAQLGGKWFYKETFTGLHHALVMKTQHKEIFTQKWGLYESMLMDNSKNASAHPPTGAANGSSTTANTRPGMPCRRKIGPGACWR